MSATAEKNTKGRVWLPNGDKIAHDIKDMNETANELLEMEQIASSRQKTLILRVRPMMRDLAHNTQLLKEHVESGSGEGRAGAYVDYAATHEEISKRLVVQIVDSIDHSNAVRASRTAK
jgi:hypothetical protein